MEENVDFAHERLVNFKTRKKTIRNIRYLRFESSDGAALIAAKWVALSASLNSIGGANKTPELWKQYWRDLRYCCFFYTSIIKFLTR